MLISVQDRGVARSGLRHVGATLGLWKLANIIVIAFKYVLVAHILDSVKDLPHVFLVLWPEGQYEWVDAPCNFAA